MYHVKILNRVIQSEFQKPHWWLHGWAQLEINNAKKKKGIEIVPVRHNRCLAESWQDRGPGTLNLDEDDFMKRQFE